MLQIELDRCENVNMNAQCNEFTIIAFSFVTVCIHIVVARCRALKKIIRQLEFFFLC